MGNFLNKLFGKTEDLYDDYDDERYDDCLLYTSRCV